MIEDALKDKQTENRICECHGQGHASDCEIGKRKCPSTYTHSNRGKLDCEKDEAHLRRIGDVEHKNGRTIWMSV